MTTLDQLKEYSKIVADTGDFNSIEEFKPLDATTNPSLILKAANDPSYNSIIRDVIDKANVKDFTNEREVDHLINRLSVGFGNEILKIVPGRVSTEVPSKFSFDTQMTIDSANEIISLYKELEVDTSRILIKVAATWEGIRAAKQLEKNGIRTNLTLVFNLCQAVACAEAGISLISPFVGRISDWHKKNSFYSSSSDVDPGVASVKEIFNYIKHFGYDTEIMAASFRSVGQITALAGCDLITISPDLLVMLKKSSSELKKSLRVEDTKKLNINRLSVDESNFRWNLSQDPMTVEKLAEGIRRFHEDYNKLANLLLRYSK